MNMMNVKEITSGWNKNEFLAFLLLHIANADLEPSEEELMFIRRLVNEDQFKIIQMVWSKCNDIQCINIIRELRVKHFPGDEGKETLMREITALASTDEHMNQGEEMMILALRKLL